MLSSAYLNKDPTLKLRRKDKKYSHYRSLAAYVAYVA